MSRSPDQRCSLHRFLCAGAFSSDGERGAADCQELSPGYHGTRSVGALKDSGSFASSIGSAFGTFGSGTATNLDKAAVAVGAAGAGPYAAGGLWQKTSFSGVGDMKSFIKGLNPHAEPAKLAAAEAKADLTERRGAEALARTEATDARADAHPGAALWAIPSWPALGSHATCSETPPAG